MGDLLYLEDLMPLLTQGGVRLGTSEIYSVVEKFQQVKESIVIGQSWNNDIRIVLFVCS